MPILINPAFAPPVTQSTLVGTPIAENNAQRVPYDNVPPSVSSPRAEPDAKKNPDYFSPTLGSSQINTASSPQEAAAGRRLSSAPFGTPATLIAQLIGQPVPQQTGGQLRTILTEYEKLITHSQTKYLPSNATRPKAEPAGLFGKLLNQAEKQEAKPQANSRPEPINNTAEDDTENAIIPVPAGEGIAPIQATGLYLASLARNETLNSAN